MNKKKKIIITGAAGFIGAAITKRLLKEGEDVFGIDNLNDYYDVNLKLNRIKSIEEAISKSNGNWVFKNCDIEKFDSIREIFNFVKPHIVINLAAQAGVRYSIKNPRSYISTNLVGFSNVLEASKENNIDNLIYASSSSVYGANRKIPFSENDQINHPLSLYGATKKANELIAHSYSNIFGISCIGLRFFTVYGPWGRPDMAPMIFAKNIFNKLPIDVFNFGRMKRDFTYIDDIVEVIFRCCYKPAISNKEFDYFNPDPSTSFAPHRVFNVGNSKQVELLDFIDILGIN